MLLVRLSKKLGEMGLSETKLGEMRLGEMLPNYYYTPRMFTAILILL